MFVVNQKSDDIIISGTKNMTKKEQTVTLLSQGCRLNHAESAKLNQFIFRKRCSRS